MRKGKKREWKRFAKLVPHTSEVNGEFFFWRPYTAVCIASLCVFIHNRSGCSKCSASGFPNWIPNGITGSLWITGNFLQSTLREKFSSSSNVLQSSYLIIGVFLMYILMKAEVLPIFRNIGFFGWNIALICDFLFM